MAKKTVRSDSQSRLAPAALRAANECRAVTRKGFLTHFRDTAGEGDPYQGYTSLTSGDPAPDGVALAFVRYLIHLGAVNSVDGALVPATPLVSDVIWDSPATVAQAIFSPPVESDASDLGDPGVEIPRVARAIVEHVGRMNPAPGSSGTAVEQGEAVMGRTLEEYTNWLRATHHRNRRAVQYAVNSKGRPVAVCVLFGTTKEVFDAVCAGKMSDAEIDPDDFLPSRGKYILVNALAPIGDHPRLPGLERERAEVFCMFRQIGYFTRGLRPFRPAFYVIAGNPHVADRLRRQGFRPTGNPLKGTEKTVMVLCHRREVGGPRMTLRERLSCLQLRLAARVFQVINFRKWRSEDRRNRAR